MTSSADSTPTTSSCSTETEAQHALVKAIEADLPLREIRELAEVIGSFDYLVDVDNDETSREYYLVVDVDVETSRESTPRDVSPLIQAIRGNRLDIVRFLVVDCHADVNYRDGDELTPLIHAIDTMHTKNCDMGVVELLVDYRADLFENDSGEYPIGLAWSCGLGHVCDLLAEAMDLSGEEAKVYM